MTCTIRRATPAEAPAISQLIITTLRVSNAGDYSPQVIAQVEQHFAPPSILQLMQQRQVYVAHAEQQLIGTAAWMAPWCEVYLWTPTGKDAA